MPTPTRLSRQVPASSFTPAPSSTTLVRRSATSDDPLGGQAVPDAMETVLRRRRGTGAPLPTALAQDLGTGFGLDLSGVRVHTDPEAARISRQLQAVAFTRGQDIYFGTGAYRPESASGRELLAHELAHVVQQRHSSTNPAGPQSVIGRADDPAERQADELAAQVIRRRRATADPTADRTTVDPPQVDPTAIRRYPVDKKNTKANKLLRNRYIQVKNPDDADHYGDEFDDLVLDTPTIEAMETLISKLEVAKAAKKVVIPVLEPEPEPSAVPLVSTPVPSTGPAKKVKPTVTTIALGPSGYVAKPVPVVDPYAGLSPKLRGLAVQITNWKTNSMDGTTASLSDTEQAQLQAWVEARSTPSGKQKYVVNIGPGTGIFASKDQFKVSGFGNVGGKAPTFHITL